MKLNRLFIHLDKKMKENFILLSLFIVFIGIIRNLLEMIGYFTKGPNFVGYYPTIPSFLNTISYVFLMVIIEGYILNLLFKGDKNQLRLLIQKGVWFLLGLFILIPALNNLFNYHFLCLPNFYDLKFIHPKLYPHYGTFGLHVAFFLVLFVFPFWLRKLYKCSLSKSFLITWPFYIIHYLVTYQLMMNFSWGYLKRFNPFIGFIEPVNVYTLGFVILTLMIYPLFLKDYPKNKSEYKRAVIVYFILWILLGFLFLTNLTWKPGGAS